MIKLEEGLRPGNGRPALRERRKCGIARRRSEKAERPRGRCLTGDPTANAGTFAVVSMHWLTGIKGTVKESTYTRYHRNVHSYLLPALGEMRVSAIDSMAVDRFREELLRNGGRRGAGLSEKTVTDILSVLKLILTYAAAEGYPAMDPSQIRNPRRRRRGILTIPCDQLERLEEGLLRAADPLSLGILLTLHTGIRIGELCGLRWGDIDFHAKTVSILRTVERIADLDPTGAARTKLIIGDPKTESSRREIPLPGALCAYLKARRGQPDTYLLSGNEKPTEPRVLYTRYTRFLRRHQLEGYTFHSLRHTFATRGLEAGFDIKSLSEILGHSDVTTTLRCYVHPSVEQKRKQMENLFNSIPRSQKYSI